MESTPPAGKAKGKRHLSEEEDDEGGAGSEEAEESGAGARKGPKVKGQRPQQTKVRQCISSCARTPRTYTHSLTTHTLTRPTSPSFLAHAFRFLSVLAKLLRTQTCMCGSCATACVVCIPTGATSIRSASGAGSA